MRAETAHAHSTDVHVCSRGAEAPTYTNTHMQKIRAQSQPKSLSTHPKTHTRTMQMRTFAIAAPATEELIRRVQNFVDQVRETTSRQYTVAHCNTLQHTATHCNILQHALQQVRETASRSHNAAHCITLQHTPTHCNILQHALQQVRETRLRQHTAAHCNTLQNTPTHCNILQHAVQQVRETT